MTTEQKRWAFGIILISLVYFLGPNPQKPSYNLDLPVLPYELSSLDEQLKNEESSLPVKPGNEAQIVWSKEPGKRSNKVLVYLHGFSASHQEGAPVHRNLARRYGMNLLLTRMAGHGLSEPDELVNYSPDLLWEEGKRALQLGHLLGDTVVLMGTSTGASLALQLAATYPELVHGLLLYSPNIRINDSNAWLLNNPWGLQIAQLVFGGNYRLIENQPVEYAKYWNVKYHLESVVQLQEYLETAMVQNTFKQITCPVFMAYYYQDQDHQDDVVRVDKALEMFDQLGTPDEYKVAFASIKAGDHVLLNPLKSSDVEGVEKQTQSFLENTLHFTPR